MLFKAGTQIISGTGNSIQVSECTDDYYVPEGFGSAAEIKVWGQVLTHDGNNAGYVEYSYAQSEYQGLKAVRKLSVFPLDYHPDKEKIRQELIACGKKYWGLTGMHYRCYNGLAKALGNEIDQKKDEYPTETTTIDSRIIADAKMFGIVKAPNRIRLYRMKRFSSSDGSEAPGLTDDEYLVCDGQLPGFSLFDKNWCLFSVNLIEEIKFDRDAFSSLHIPPDRKQLVRALVQDHVSEVDQFDDLIKGKGKGLVFVLHGVPGVGKTYTAEAVADDIQRPLYILNSGELGFDPHSVEKNLVAALKLSAAWKAIVLIDEADVFLEQRTSQDLARNSLVSLFLRHLEYYQGVLILTTNRISTFDLAFKSRIHLALKYQNLDEPQKESLWQQFLKRTHNIDEEYWTKARLDKLISFPLNGRQIKNTVRTANALARSKAKKLKIEHLDVVLKTIQEFEDDLNTETQDPMLGTELALLRKWKQSFANTE